LAAPQFMKTRSHQKTKIAGVALAIGIALGDFGEACARLQFRLGRLDDGARLRFAAALVDMHNNVGRAGLFGDGKVPSRSDRAASPRRW